MTTLQSHIYSPELTFVPSGNEIKPLKLRSLTEHARDHISSNVVRMNATIMIVDDEPINVRVVRKYLQDFGYENFLTTSESTAALEIIRKEQPDVLLLDVKMPRVNGLEILQAMRDDADLAHIPVLVLTAAKDAETKFKALFLGATDFLAKPVDPSELALRVRNALVVKAHHDHLADYSEKLECEVNRRTAELEASRQDVIHCLARAAEYRDSETGRHVIRVGLYAGIIGNELGFDRTRVKLLQQAAKLHDVGKIGVSDSVLLKPGKLSQEEFKLMQQHCDYGRNIIQRPEHHDGQWPPQPATLKQSETDSLLDEMNDKGSPILALAAIIAQTHHEKWDGSGYPRGLKGEEIPIEGRITAVADVFDALSTQRPYKPAFPLEKCFGILKEGRGTHFDPRVVDAFLRRERDVVRVHTEFADTGDSQTNSSRSNA